MDKPAARTMCIVQIRRCYVELFGHASRSRYEKVMLKVRAKSVSDLFAGTKKLLMKNEKRLSINNTCTREDDSMNYVDRGLKLNP